MIADNAITGESMVGDPPIVRSLTAMLIDWANDEPEQWAQFCDEVDAGGVEYLYRHVLALQPNDVHNGDQPTPQLDLLQHVPPRDEGDADAALVFSEREAPHMTRDSFDNLPAPIAVRARHFAESDPTISRAEAVTLAMNSPEARKAYARDVNKRNREIATGVAEGPKEPRQWREEYGSAWEGTPSGGNGRSGRSGNGAPSKVRFDPMALGQVLEAAILKIQARHPEYSRSQLIIEAMKIPSVRQAYDDDRAINGVDSDD